jgi:hypothetical protein
MCQNAKNLLAEFISAIQTSFGIRVEREIRGRITNNIYGNALNASAAADTDERRRPLKYIYAYMGQLGSFEIAVGLPACLGTKTL